MFEPPKDIVHFPHPPVISNQQDKSLDIWKQDLAEFIVDGKPVKFKRKANSIPKSTLISNPEAPKQIDESPSILLVTPMQPIVVNKFTLPRDSRASGMNSPACRQVIVDDESLDGKVQEMLRAQFVKECFNN